MELHRDVDQKVFSKLSRKYGIEAEAVGEFLNLPYEEAVAIAQDVARGGHSGTRFGLTPDLFSFSVGDLYRWDSASEDVKTKQILNELIFRKHFICQFGSMDKAALCTNLQIRGLQHIEKAVADGRRVCLLNSHFGIGQIAPLILARCGFGVTYMGARNLFAQFGVETGDNIDFLFTSSGFQAAIVGGGIKALEAGRILNTTGDGFSGVSGQKHPFLRSSRIVREGFAYLIVMANAATIPVFSQVDANGGMSVTYHEALDELPQDAPRQDKINFVIRQYLKLLEAYWMSDIGNVERSHLRKYADTLQNAHDRRE